MIFELGCPTTAPFAEMHRRTAAQTRAAICFAGLETLVGAQLCRAIVMAPDSIRRCQIARQDALAGLVDPRADTGVIFDHIQERDGIGGPGDQLCHFLGAVRIGLGRGVICIGQQAQRRLGLFLLHRLGHQIVEMNRGVVRVFGGCNNPHHRTVGNQIGLQAGCTFDGRKGHDAKVAIMRSGFDVAKAPRPHREHRRLAGQEQVGRGRIVFRQIAGRKEAVIQQALEQLRCLHRFG